MSRILEPSPKPSHSTVIGMSADLGIGYSISTSGLTSASTGRHQAISTPRAPPTSTASASPAPARQSDAAVLAQRSPARISFHPAASTSVGGGSTSGEIQPSRTVASQTAATSAIGR